MFTNVNVIVIAGDGMFGYLVHCSNDPTFLADVGANIMFEICLLRKD